MEDTEDTEKPYCYHCYPDFGKCEMCVSFKELTQTLEKLSIESVCWSPVDDKDEK